MARGPIADKPRERPQVPEVMKAARAYLAKPGAPHPEWVPHFENGGSLHIVLIDHNETDRDIEWCRDLARDCDDEDGLALCDLLLAMTRTQRRRICRGHR